MSSSTVHSTVPVLFFGILTGTRWESLFFFLAPCHCCQPHNMQRQYGKYLSYHDASMHTSSWCHPVGYAEASSSCADANSVACRREPRKGRRLTLAAQIITPAGPIQVYSAHLEVFCGAFSRMKQFADILTHARASKVPMQVTNSTCSFSGSCCSFYPAMPSST